MKKPTIIIGKKQIIMTCLTLMLAVAVYINYTASPKIAPDSSGNEFREDIKYGETEFVNAEAPLTADDYFAQARLDKQNSRDSAVQTLLPEEDIVGLDDLETIAIQVFDIEAGRSVGKGRHRADILPLRGDFLMEGGDVPAVELGGENPEVSRSDGEGNRQGLPL